MMRMGLLASVILVMLLLPACSPAVLSPGIVGEWESPELITGAAASEVRGRPYLFLATQPGQGGTSRVTLRVLSVQDSAEPVEVAVLEAPVESLMPLGGLAVSGDTVYVGLTGGTESGLWVVDVSDPAEPREITLMDAGYAVWGVRLSGDLVAVKTALGPYFALIDVSDRARPRKVTDFALDREGRQRPATSYLRMALDGHDFFVLDVDGLTVFDVSSPSAPRQAAFHGNEDWDGPVAEPVEGAGTSVLSRTEKVAREGVLGDVAPAGGFMDIAVSGDRAYIAASDLGLIVIDVSEPASPREVARLQVPDRPRRVIVAGDLVYLLGFRIPDDETWRDMAGWTHPLHVVDVSDPAEPRLLATFEGITGLPPWQALLALGDRLCVVSNTTVHVIDLYAGQ